MHINPDTYPAKALYKLMTSAVVPRPIALVLSRGSLGVVNVAPFSYFNVVTSAPPRLSISISKQNGLRKDTARNIVETGYFVVHVVTTDILEDVNRTSAPLPAHESELSLTQFSLHETADGGLPHIQNSPVRFTCTLEQTVTFPEAELFIGKVTGIDIEPRVFDAERGIIDTAALKPVARLGGPHYAQLGAITTLKRP
ncbi:MAG: flavin reductase family protein [Acholeplasmatales bacterium]|nr:MAG: flavin reductase family protein [Acholeplasmatales bacterium]